MGMYFWLYCLQEQNFKDNAFWKQNSEALADEETARGFWQGA